MTTITLTSEQTRAINKAAEAQHAKIYVSLQKRTNAQVARAEARTVAWKQHYRAARKSLIEARSEINELKRRLRDGDFE